MDTHTASDPRRGGSSLCKVLGSGTHSLSLVFIICARKLEQSPEQGHQWNEFTQVAWIIILLVSPLATLPRHQASSAWCFFFCVSCKILRMGYFILFCLHLEEFFYLDINTKNFPLTFFLSHIMHKICITYLEAQTGQILTAFSHPWVPIAFYPIFTILSACCTE